MRLHRLQVRAFGPFAGTEDVDVDALAADGLFLLHGQTGAGKTSVLDALCFALYGRVPGARSSGVVDLRSHHAAPDAAPQVRCEVTVGGRRFEVTRSPAWERAKRRGSGTTTEQARMVLRVWAGGGWTPLSARTDEASAVLTDALGMGLEQFTRVVLLPQGEFAAFLRSGGRERGELLARLFGTERFTAVEAWLAEQRRAAEREVAGHAARLDQLLARAEQVAADWPVPGGTDQPGSTDQPSSTGPLAEGADGSVAAALTRVRCAAATADADHERAREAARAARAGEQEARARAEQVRSYLALRASEAQLAEEAPATELLRRRSSAAARASGLAGHLQAAARAGQEARTAHGATTAARDELERLDAALSRAGAGALAAAAAQQREEAGRLEELVALEAAVRARAAHLGAAQVRCAELTAAVATAGDALADLAVRREDASARLAGLAARAGRLEALVAEQDATRAAAAAAVRAQALAEQLQPLRRTALAATGAAQDLRAVWLDLRQARIEGMAAELAAALVPGQPCAVCGSPEHPALAAPPSGRTPPGAAVGAGPSAAAEDAAQAHHERAEAERREAQEVLARAEQDLAVARSAAAGRDVAGATAAFERAVAAVTGARHAQEEAAATQAVLSRLQEDSAAQGERHEEATADLRIATAGCQQLAAGLDHDRARLARARGDDPSLARRRERLRVTATSADALARALEAGQRAAEQDRAAAALAAQAALQAGFADPAAARAASLEPADLARLDEDVARHDRAVASVRVRLGEAGCRAAAAELGATPHLDAAAALAAAERSLTTAERSLAEADTRLEAAARAAERCRSPAAALGVLLEATTGEVRAGAPLRERARLVGDLSRCAEGTGGDNTRRMKLSAYVLAARLEQVAAAATTRLQDMSDQRYTLVHTDDLERRGASSGLGLRVVDGWTGRSRDTTTLSGGETFLASLALALGLADVVQAEAGGTPIETLFVDEGFGTLDEDALEEVMGTLEQLRAGGRAVGVVSHVPELRTRIPSRLEVVKGRAGSHLRATVP